MKSKKILSLAMAVAMILPTVSCATKTKTPDIDGYKLLWSDEFDGKKMDEKKWNYEPHEPGWTNNELQEYTTSTDNVFVRDGKLVLKAIKTTRPTSSTARSSFPPRFLRDRVSGPPSG